MADEKPRAPRARKKASDTDAVAEPKTATKPAAKKKATTTTARRRAAVALVAEPGHVAVRAYYLWQQGEPGDATEHWLRAEQELAA
jgi:hypothetical protein